MRVPLQPRETGAASIHLANRRRQWQGWGNQAGHEVEMAEAVAIIGAGLGGLTCALALARAGRAVTVYEQAPELAEVGAGITLSPNSSRIMIALGLEEDMRRLGVVPPRQLTQNLQTGAVLIERERGNAVEAQYGAPYIHLHRADLHRLLAEAFEAAQPGAIRLGHQLEQITSDEAGARLTFRGGEGATAAIAVGADGVKSVTRDALFATQPPQFTGQVAWRGVLPRAVLPQEVQDLPPGIWIGEKRLFMRYPIRDWELVNYVAFVNLDGWEEEGWAIPSTREELLGYYADAEPHLKALIEATPPELLFKWALHAREPLDSWIAGSVTLLGDAAHGMLPFMGQGAATAIEDGMVLARCLIAFPKAEALRRYEAARRDRTTMVQIQSRLLGLQFQGKDPESFGKGPILNEDTLGLFAYDAVNCPI
jgi:salicylate hydroxylase